jgi:hypothetical protein
MDIGKALEELGVDESSYKVLGLLPLVYVAWADGTIQRKERSLILDTAEEHGWLSGGGRAVLDKWLAEPPSDAYMRKGVRVLNALAADGGRTSLNADSLELLLLLCNDVAKAAGGFFGLSDPVTEAEEQALEKVAIVFDIEHANTWGELLARSADEDSDESSEA